MDRRGRQPDLLRNPAPVPLALFGQDGRQPESHEPAPQGVLPHGHVDNRRLGVGQGAPGPVDEEERPLVAVRGGGHTGGLGEDRVRAPGQGEHDVPVVSADGALQRLDRVPADCQARQDAGVQHPELASVQQSGGLGRGPPERPDECPRDRVRGCAPSLDPDDEDLDRL